MKKIATIVITLFFGTALAFAQDNYVSHNDNAFDETIAQYFNDDTPAASYFEAFKDASFPTENNYDYTVVDLSKNPDKIAAGVLNILLGDIGIGHFYTGQTLRGILDILFCWTGIPAIIGLVEGIIWLCEDDDAWAERVAKWNS